MSGDIGNDTLLGGRGNDDLTGWLGNDVLTGGADADTFHYDFSNTASPNTDGHDRITDFTHGEDKLDIAVFHSGAEELAMFDTNHDDTINGSDAHSRVIGGALVLDVASAEGAGGFSTDSAATLTLTNVPYLVQSDFLL